MADSNNDGVRRRSSRRSTSNVTDNDAVTECDDLGRFAHRLSLDVTHDALTLASHNGGITTVEASQIEVDEEPPTASSSSERPQSLPNTPGGSGSRLAEAPSYDECRKHHQKTPVGKIRDVSRTLAKWLRFKSKSINGLNDRGEGVHVDPPWRPWRKSTKPTRQDLCKRALPPVPVGGGGAAETSCAESVVAVNDEPEASQPQPRLNRSLEGLMPGDAYIPDDDDDENIANFSTATGNIDFAASIEKVKSYGWYWGPISGEAAERLLLNEPDGSFVVRDSSDDHYIFSLTFKLNGTVRHVRIEHDQGNFSFGSFTKFKSNTIVDFIENAVEHSRSGRYLFFLHRRPVFGPMRVQLLHPVSRFKQVQSLQHLCRFVILKLVPRDLLYHLPVPKRLRDYLNTPFYYCEAIAEWTDEKNLPTSSSMNTSSAMGMGEVEGEALLPPSQPESNPEVDDQGQREPELSSASMTESYSTT